MKLQAILWRGLALLAMIGGLNLLGCTSVPLEPHLPQKNPSQSQNSEPNSAKMPTEPAGTAIKIEANEIPPNLPDILQTKSRWTAVRWADLPGWAEDDVHEAWSAWLLNCQRPAAVWQKLCQEVRQLSIASSEEQRAWMQGKLQPYRVNALSGSNDGLLTGYYEPVLDASRRPTTTQRVALWQPPATLSQRKPWFSRKEIDTVPEAQAALRGREIAYLADPIDALVLQIQGSGKLRLTEPDGSVRMIRVAYAGTNEQPYASVGRWLLDQGLIRDASWPGIKAWIAASSPERVQEMLWSNPRMVFFKEEALQGEAASLGPRGALGVPLSAGRSIAVDRLSIPLGVPVWLASSGETFRTQRLVFAQDVGSAIAGAVRADYYVGSGDAAGQLAGRLKQGLQMWVLWPKSDAN